MSRSRSYFSALVLLCCTLTGATYGQHRYDTCEIFQFLDNDSSYVEKIAVQNFSEGHIMSEVSVANLPNKDSYLLCKRLKGTEIFKGGDSTKVQEIRRFDFVSSSYAYNKDGTLKHAAHINDDDGIFSNEHDMYEYGQGGRLSRKYDFDVAHDMIHGVVVNYYTYDGSGRLLSDSSVEDHRLVFNYQWDEENNHLSVIDTTSMRWVPVYSANNLRFMFEDEKDTLNRRTEAKIYHYFDGGQEIRSTFYHWQSTTPGPCDSIFTNKAGMPARSIQHGANTRQIEKNYYYNDNGDLARTDITESAGGNSGSITRIYKYKMKKTTVNKKK